MTLRVATPSGAPRQAPLESKCQGQFLAYFGVCSVLLSCCGPRCSQRKRKQKLHCNFWKVALKKLHCNICFFAVHMSFLPKNRAATNEKLHCNIEKAALQESGAFLLLSCGFQAPTFRHTHTHTHTHTFRTC